MSIAITTAIDSKGKVGKWASRDIPVLESLAWCQRCIDFCWATRYLKVLDQRRTLAVAKLPDTQSTYLGNLGNRVSIKRWVSREGTGKQSLDSKLTAKLDPCAGRMQCRLRTRVIAPMNVAVVDRRTTLQQGSRLLLYHR